VSLLVTKAQVSGVTAGDTGLSLLVTKAQVKGLLFRLDNHC